MTINLGSHGTEAVAVLAIFIVMMALCAPFLVGIARREAKEAR